MYTHQENSGICDVPIWSS